MFFRLNYIRLVAVMLFNKRLALHCFALVVMLLLPLDLFAEVLVVTGANSSSINLSKNQVRDIFLGRTPSLPGGRNATVIDQPDSSPIREEFYLKVMSKSAAQIKAHWAQLFFTGGGEPPCEGRSSADIKKRLNTIPGAISYIERSALDSSVNVLFDVQ